MEAQSVAQSPNREGGGRASMPDEIPFTLDGRAVKARPGETIPATRFHKRRFW